MGIATCCEDQVSSNVEDCLGGSLAMFEYRLRSILSGWAILLRYFERD